MTRPAHRPRRPYAVQQVPPSPIPISPFSEEYNLRMHEIAECYGVDTLPTNEDVLHYVDELRESIRDEYRDFMNHNLKYCAWEWGKMFDNAMHNHLLDFMGAMDLHTRAEVMEKLGENALNKLMRMADETAQRRPVEKQMDFVGADPFVQIYNRWQFHAVLDGMEITYEDYYNTYFEFKDDLTPPPENPPNSPRKRSRKK